jgi:Zn finger protein HypA/HybF involved in hydrogenase expression
MEYSQTQPSALHNQLNCKNCAATLKYKVGTRMLVCEYCGTENEIISEEEEKATVIKEINLEEYINQVENRELKVQTTLVKCGQCAAETTLKPNITADICPFCGTPLIIQNATLSSVHRPNYLLPFKVEVREAQEKYKKWIKGLWFTPNDLKKYATDFDKLQGVYLPFWTYDCQTITTYTGQRGEWYYVTETYTETVDGKTVTRTREVRKTRWYNVSGTVNNRFDDILIPASQSLNTKKLKELEPWDLKSLVSYDERFISGMKSENYQLSLAEGYVKAKEEMQPRIRQSIYRDIGGDEQSISYQNTTYHSATFKHILLPVWLSAYRYKDKTYQFMINARTGEVQGSYPVSATKIILLIVAIITILLVLYFINN